MKNIVVLEFTIFPRRVLFLRIFIFLVLLFLFVCDIFNFSIHLLTAHNPRQSLNIIPSNAFSTVFLSYSKANTLLQLPSIQLNCSYLPTKQHNEHRLSWEEVIKIYIVFTQFMLLQFACFSHLIFTTFSHKARTNMKQEWFFFLKYLHHPHPRRRSTRKEEIRCCEYISLFFCWKSRERQIETFELFRQSGVNCFALETLISWARYPVTLRIYFDTSFKYLKDLFYRFFH